MAKTSKDRTQLFEGSTEFIISSETGARILNWCNDGKSLAIPSNEKLYPYRTQITACKSVEELLTLYKAQSIQVQQQFHCIIYEETK
jgi:hypothetical protein